MEAALRKRTEYFREYQRMRRDIAAKNGMCVDCTTRIRAQDSTRCQDCLERARNSMRAKRAATS